MTTSPLHKAAIGVFSNQCHVSNYYVDAWKKRTWTMIISYVLAKLDLMFKHRTLMEIIYSGYVKFIQLFSMSPLDNFG